MKSHTPSSSCTRSTLCRRDTSTASGTRGAISPACSASAIWLRSSWSCTGGRAWAEAGARARRSAGTPRRRSSGSRPRSQQRSSSSIWSCGRLASPEGPMTVFHNLRPAPPRQCSSFPRSSSSTTPSLMIGLAEGGAHLPLELNRKEWVQKGALFSTAPTSSSSDERERGMSTASSEAQSHPPSRSRRNRAFSSRSTSRPHGGSARGPGGAILGPFGPARSPW